nr:MAG TPA_asm: DNA directed DNA polymerase [Caudoviricetes sp.]
MKENYFISHLPCPNCGSHDALAVYSDGHGYCFSYERKLFHQSFTMP